IDRHALGTPGMARWDERQGQSLVFSARAVAATMLPRAMAYEFKLPDLGEGLTEGEIARWLVAEGQEIAEDDLLVEIQTDKTTVEIPSPAAGVVSKLFAAEGDVVPVGTVIVSIADDSAPASAAVSTAAAAEDVPDQPQAETAV